MTDVPAPQERPRDDDELPLRFAAMWLGVLVLGAAATSGLHVADRVPGWFADLVGWLWSVSVLGATFAVGREVSRTVRAVAVPLLAGFAVLVGLRVPDSGGWSTALNQMAVVAGTLVLAMVLVPPMLAGKRAWERRHPAPMAAQRIGLSAEAEAAEALPLHWSTGTRTVVIDDVGDRRVQVIKLLRDLGANLDFLAVGAAVRRPEHGPTVPVVAATGLSDDDATALLAALQKCRASGRIL